MAKANAKRSSICAHVEHVFTEQKDRIGLLIRAIGLARVKTKIDLANLAHNMRRLIWLEQTAEASAEDRAGWPLLAPRRRRKFPRFRANRGIQSRPSRLGRGSLRIKRVGRLVCRFVATFERAI